MQCVGNILLAALALAISRTHPTAVELRKRFAHRAMAHVDASICPLNQKLWLLAWHLEYAEYPRVASENW